MLPDYDTIMLMLNVRMLGREANIKETDKVLVKMYLLFKKDNTGKCSLSLVRLHTCSNRLQK